MLIKLNKIDKTKFTLFRKARQSNNIPLVLPTLKERNTVIKWVDHIKFFSVLFEKNHIWRNHINLTENKTSKSLGILHPAKFLLNQKPRENVYFFFIHSYTTMVTLLGEVRTKSNWRKYSFIKKNS